MDTGVSEIIPADDPIAATRYTNAGKHEGPELQQHYGAVGKKKRIYSFSFKVSKNDLKLTINLPIIWNALKTIANNVCLKYVILHRKPKF